jgi:hypothetical protein
VALQEELSALELENRDLKRELERQKAALPKVEPLLITRSDAGANIAVELVRRPVTEAEIAAREQAEEIRIGRIESVHLAVMRHDTREEEFARAALREFKAWLPDFVQQEQARGRSFLLSFGLKNVGTALAKRIELDAQFPEGFELRVSPAMHWRSVYPRFRGGPTHIDELRLPSEALDEGLAFEAVAPRINENWLTYSAGELMHHSPPLQLRDVVVTLPADWSGRGFQIETQVRVEGLTTPSPKVLRVKVSWRDEAIFAPLDAADAEDERRRAASHRR